MLLNIVFAINVFFSIPLFAAHYSAESYSYKFPDFLLASISSAANQPSLQYEVVKIDFKPERSNIPLLEGRQKVAVSLLIQKKTDAPVMFVISGIGGTAVSGSALFLAEEFFKQGFSVIALPNPMNWQYAIGVSSNNTPGYLPYDTNDFYDFLKFTYQNVKQQYNLKPKSFSISGYSYGGLAAGFLIKQDEVAKQFNFSGAIIINPAVSISHGVAVLDAYYDYGNKYSEQRKMHIQGAVIDAGLELLKTGITPQSLMKAVKTLEEITPEQKKWLIGNAFRSDLADIIFANQQIKDTGILKNAATTYRRSARMAEAKQVTFVDYILKLVVPALEKVTPTMTSDALYYNSSLYALEDLLKNHPRIFIQENVDDFLLKSGDIEWIKDTFGERAFIYPYGGHVGNLWVPENVQDRRLMLNQLIL